MHTSTSQVRNSQHEAVHPCSALPCWSCKPLYSSCSSIGTVPAEALVKKVSALMLSLATAASNAGVAPSSCSHCGSGSATQSVGSEVEFVRRRHARLTHQSSPTASACEFSAMVPSAATQGCARVSDQSLKGRTSERTRTSGCTESCNQSTPRRSVMGEKTPQMRSVLPAVQLGRRHSIHRELLHGHGVNCTQQLRVAPTVLLSMPAAVGIHLRWCMREGGCGNNQRVSCQRVPCAAL